MNKNEGLWFLIEVYCRENWRAHLVSKDWRTTQTLEDKPMAGGNGSVRHILQKIEKHESLAGVDLRNLYLSGMDLSNLDLRGANLKGCRLSNGKLAASDLTNADLTDTMLINASFKKANLVGTVFHGAVVVGADFSEAKGMSAEQIKYLKSKGAKGL